MTATQNLAAGLALLAFSASVAGAQQAPAVLPGVSPIPEGANNNYCYYGGLAYSPNSYLPVLYPTQERAAATATGDATLVITGNPDTRIILLQCVDAEAVGRSECSAGGMAWAVRQNVAVSPRVEQ